jgi:hypothetical protein
MSIKLNEILDSKQRALFAAAAGYPVAAGIPHAQPQPRPEWKPTPKDRPKDGGGPSVVLRVVRLACRLVDADNLGGAKFLIDAIRRSGLIRDDDPQTVEIQLLTEHVKIRAEEGTAVEII